MKHVTLPCGEVVPSMGQGTWKMGERAERRSNEIAALRAGVELGMTLVDTAEMYGDGAAETLICEALGDRRDQLFLVSKAYPQNASRSGLAGECKASLKRLGGLHASLVLTQHAYDLILGKTASPHRSSPSDELTYQWHVFRGARHKRSQIRGLSSAGGHSNLQQHGYRLDRGRHYSSCGRDRSTAPLRTRPGGLVCLVTLGDA